MEGKANQAAVIYEEFEPLCKWQRKEDRDILEIHLEGFKKEELKVQISNYGILKISGERRIDASTTTKAKFYKEVTVSSNNYDTSGIHAKFIHGMLYITLPKKKTPIPENEKIPTSAETASKIDEQPPKQEMAKKDHQPTAAAPTECQLLGLKRRTSAARFTKVAVTLAATAALMAVLVAYVVYMYKSTTDTVESLDVDDWYMY